MQLFLLLSVCCVGALAASSDNVSFQSLLARMDTMEQSHASVVGKLTARLAAAEKKIEELKDDVTTLVGKVAEAGTVSQDTAVRRRGIQDGHIAFTAYLRHDRDDIDSNTTIVFDKIITNEGDAYDNDTGIFTAPLAGVYYFSFFVAEKDDQQVYVGLKQNSYHKVDAVAEGVEAGHDAQGANAATLVLQQGDEVYVNHQTGRKGSHVEGSQRSRLSTFSGFLLYQVEPTDLFPGLVG